MKNFLITFIIILLTCSNSSNAAFWNKSSQTQPPQQTQTTQPVGTSSPQQSSTETTFPQDVDSSPISANEYIDEDIDPEQMYREIPVPEFRYMHDIDPGEYQDVRNSTWSPYPLFRLTAPLFFKSITIQPGYYLLTPREHEGAWFILFKEAGKVKYIVPCYKKEMVPFNFYKNNLPQVKLTTTQKIREKTLEFVGKHFDSSKRDPIPDTYLDANDLDNNFLSVIVYWGNYRYYMVLRTIQL